MTILRTRGFMFSEMIVHLLMEISESLNRHGFDALHPIKKGNALNPGRFGVPRVLQSARSVTNSERPIGREWANIQGGRVTMGLRIIRRSRLVALVLVLGLGITLAVLSRSGRLARMTKRGSPDTVAKYFGLYDNPANFCFIVNEQQLNRLTSRPKSNIPWQYDGDSSLATESDNPVLSTSCKARDYMGKSQSEARIDFELNVYQSEQELIFYENLKVAKLRQVSEDYGRPVPQDWGAGGVLMSEVLLLYRGCSSGRYYTLILSDITSNKERELAASGKGLLELTESTFRKIDKMPFCSEKKPWYRR